MSPNRRTSSGHSEKATQGNHRNGLTSSMMLRKEKKKANGYGAGGSTAARTSTSTKFRLQADLLVRIHDTMVKTRVLEERLIRMYKQSDGYFWIGGPGEEAFNIPLGMQVKKGRGPDYDFLHLHYRSSGILLSMGAEPVDFLRQMKNVASDPFSGGRNFANHPSRKEWNVVPTTSTIETQYATAIGTGIAQARHGGNGVTIVNGGDAGTAEGEFASCLVWASRPALKLPVLIIAMNNEWGISTAASEQHGEKNISDRARAFGMPAVTINGNDVEESWTEIEKGMNYVRNERKPYFIEARVSRLYGHSSASGANFVTNEEDPLVTFENKLESAGILSRKQMEEVRARYTAEILEMAKQVKQEPMPDAETIYDHIYCGQKGRYW